MFGEKGQIPAVLQELEGRVVVCLDVLEPALDGRPYLLGDDFSGADVMMGYSVMLARRVTSIDGRPNLVAYWERLSARPAFQQATAPKAS